MTHTSRADVLKIQRDRGRVMIGQKQKKRNQKELEEAKKKGAVMVVLWIPTLLLTTTTVRKSILSLLVKNPSYELQISVISMQELYTGSSTLHIQKEKDLVTTTSQFHIVSYTYEIAKLAGIFEGI